MGSSVGAEPATGSPCRWGGPGLVRRTAGQLHRVPRSRVRQIHAVRNRLGDPSPQSHRGCRRQDRKSTRLNSSHVKISYAVFCLKKKKKFKKNLTLLK